MTTLDIAVIPGDGIGPEVIRAGMQVLEAAAALDGSLSLRFEELPWGGGYYLDHQRVMPADGVRQLSRFHAIYLGPLGSPGVPERAPFAELLQPVNVAFDHYIQLRPVKLLRGVDSPLRMRQPEDIDILIVQAGLDGDYGDAGELDKDGARQVNRLRRDDAERVLHYAFETASRSERKQLTLATKSERVGATMALWDGVFAALQREYPSVRAEVFPADTLAGLMVVRPDRFDVVAAPPLIGDMLAKMGAVLGGGIALAPVAYLNPEGESPSAFGPAHGPVHFLAGKGLANPIGAIWAAAVMLEHLGYGQLGYIVIESVQRVLHEQGKVRTPDLGKKAKTQQVVDAVLRRVREWRG